MLCLGTNDLLGHDGCSKSYPTSANAAVKLARPPAHVRGRLCSNVSRLVHLHTYHTYTETYQKICAYACVYAGFGCQGAVSLALEEIATKLELSCSLILSMFKIIVQRLLIFLKQVNFTEIVKDFRAH